MFLLGLNHLDPTTAFAPSTARTINLSRAAKPTTLQMTIEEEGNFEDEEDLENMPMIAQSEVKIDDHGSDLTDRFKYKVNALMGNYAPSQPDADNEDTDGNILNALMNFPAPYAFNIVGKTKGEEALVDGYISKVKEIVGASSGGGDDILEFAVKPRGKNFTKITAEVMVESSGMINTIYDELAKLEETIMRF